MRAGPRWTNCEAAGLGTGERPNLKAVEDAGAAHPGQGGDLHLPIARLGEGRVEVPGGGSQSPGQDGGRLPPGHQLFPLQGLRQLQVHVHADALGVRDLVGRQRPDGLRCSRTTG